MYPNRNVRFLAGGNAMAIPDCVAVGALMLVLILWSTTRLFPDYIAVAALIMLIPWAAARLFTQGLPVAPHTS
jgi:hypothetical protein